MLVFLITSLYVSNMTENKNIFTIIIADLIKSRDIPDRGKISLHIQSALDSVNSQFENEFFAPIILTRGMDELSGVLNRLDSSYKICHEINTLMKKYQFRFAIVRGIIDIGLDSRNAAKMDGPAFHKAADLIKKARYNNLRYLFDLGSAYRGYNQCLNDLVNLVDIIRSEWTPHQRNVAKLYEIHKHQERTARDLGITQQAVSDALISAHLKAIKRAENTIEKILMGCERNSYEFPDDRTTKNGDHE